MNSIKFHLDKLIIVTIIVFALTCGFLYQENLELKNRVEALEEQTATMVDLWELQLEINNLLV